MAQSLNFGVAYAVDAYSMSGKIMGRQSAGAGLLKALVALSGADDLHMLGLFPQESEAALAQLKALGFRGRMHWHRGVASPDMAKAGALYYPAPPSESLAHVRNSQGPAAYSLFGVTHSLSSNDAMERVSRMATAPFQPWDALICTSQAALSVVERLQQGHRDWSVEHLGATKFNPIQLPVIPLGVDDEAMARTPASTAEARAGLKIADDEVVFLAPGRMVFHAKANHAPLYQALEAVAQATGLKLACLEAGIVGTEAAGTAYVAARAALAPSVRFLQADGADLAAYRGAWQAADVFVSLADNIQETFGLTPIEAMAAGLPVIVSDWDGYRDTVRDGVDGFRVRTVTPAPGTAADLAYRHAAELDSYDHFVGRVSFATAVDPGELAQALTRLAQDPGLRTRMGVAGRARALADYRWPVIAGRYVDLATELAAIRAAAGAPSPVAWPRRPDPFALFQDYPTAVANLAWRVEATAGREALDQLLTLSMATALLDVLTPRDAILAIHARALAGGGALGEILAAVGGATPERLRAAMWLYKFGMIRMREG